MDDFELSMLPPLQLWLKVSSLLLWTAANYFVFVSFVLWLRDFRNGTPIDPRAIFRTTSGLMVPLTILSIRGAILFVLGLFLFLVPGIYFLFKYGLATFFLILEGWPQDRSPEHFPIARSQSMIARYRFKLLPLAGVMIIGMILPSSIEFGIKSMQGGTLSVPIRILLSLMDGGLEMMINVFVALVVIHSRKA
jgi:hypothetical protein